MSALDALKELMCDAFCGEIAVRKVPAGLAVSTGFEAPDGDTIGFYVVRDELSHAYRLEDGGTLIPELEAEGVNLQRGTRAEAFQKLLAEYECEYDTDTCVLHTAYMAADAVPKASLRFLAMMLRLQDLELLHPQSVERAFADDASKAIRAKFQNVAPVEMGGVIDDTLTNYVVDAILRPTGQPPVAVYYATSGSRVDEAVILHMDANLHGKRLKVVLLLDSLNPAGVPKRSLARAHNVLDALPVFDVPAAAMDKIYSVALGSHGATH